MGPAISNGFGLSAKPDSEITAYFNGLNCPLEPWEFRAVRAMCQAYLSGLMTGTDKFGIAPIDRKPTER